ncbi:hypothetical protein C1H46_041379 [Malus baccata]|uniref:Uncharacterized protein n=1 Tax=Malus baccata TaxID=106549 RepID=A0A540KGI0_MALBA|nr:hypothetical protein C1H46_041379 [Malus baccata]
MPVYRPEMPSHDGICPDVPIGGFSGMLASGPIDVDMRGLLDHKEDLNKHLEKELKKHLEKELKKHLEKERGHIRAPVLLSSVWFAFLSAI